MQQLPITAMNPIQRKVIQEAMRFLEGAGAKFAIVDTEGTKYGTLELAAPPKPTPKKRRDWTRLEPMLDRATAGMAPMVFKPEGDETLSMLQAAVCNGARVRFGSGNYRTMRVNEAISLLVFEAPKVEA